MIGAVVLAAGASSRMGTPKSLLMIDGKTFLQHIIDELGSAGIRDIVIVLGADAERIRPSLRDSSARIVVNEVWSRGQLTSLIAGLTVLETANLDGVLVWPVDRPLVQEDVVKELIGAFQISLKIVIPVFEGRRGHPIIFPATLFEELRNADPAIGARQIVHRHPDDVVEVVTDREGVVLNIDTPEDYHTRIVTRLNGITAG